MSVLRMALVAGMLAGMLAAPAPAFASIHTYHERPGQTTDRSRLTLPDRQNRAWQAILFHRYSAEADQGVYLRLVGFPGQAVDATAPLRIQTGTGLEWQAPASALSLPQPQPDNVGQYDVGALLPQLRSAVPLTLELPLAGGRRQQLVAAPFVVAEWRQLAAMAPAK